jgi:hypothetical protein
VQTESGLETPTRIYEQLHAAPLFQPVYREKARYCKVWHKKADKNEMQLVRCSHSRPSPLKKNKMTRMHDFDGKSVANTRFPKISPKVA